MPSRAARNAGDHALIAVIGEYPTGPRALFTLPVNGDDVAKMERAAARAVFIAERDNIAVRIDVTPFTVTHGRGATTTAARFPVPTAA